MDHDPDGVVGVVADFNEVIQLLLSRRYSGMVWSFLPDSRLSLVMAEVGLSLPLSGFLHSVSHGPLRVPPCPLLARVPSQSEEILFKG